MINLLLYVVFLALIVYGGTVEALGPKKAAAAERYSSLLYGLVVSVLANFGLS